MDVIKLIKQKKELSGVADSLVKDMLEKYIRKHNISLKNLRAQEIKIIIKEIRSQLRNLTGRFQKTQKKRIKLLEKENFKELLKTHTSTNERLNFYPELKKLIQRLGVKSILDLACGLNPIALANKNILYYAADIKEDDLKLVEAYFNKNNIKGGVFTYDLRKISDNLPKADICLLFKILDILEKDTHNIANKIIENVQCKYFLISFSTKTLSGKPMKQQRRVWLERLLDSRHYTYESFASDNEIFYLVTKTTTINHFRNLSQEYIRPC